MAGLTFVEQLRVDFMRSGAYSPLRYLGCYSYRYYQCHGKTVPPPLLPHRLHQPPRLLRSKPPSVSSVKEPTATELTA